LLRFSEEVSAVYEHINEYRGQINAGYVRANRAKPKNFIAIANISLLILIGILYAALYFLPSTVWGDNTADIRVGVQLIVLLIYILGGLVMFLQSRSFKELSKDFTGQIINDAAKSAKDEAALFQSFNELSIQSIEYVANQLEETSAQLGQIRTFILGAIEKVGIIPGLLATVVAINKVADSTGVSWVELLSFFMAGIYMGMFLIFETSIKIKRVSRLLNQYLALFRFNETDIDRNNKSEHDTVLEQVNK